MGFCPFGKNEDKINVKNSCIITCALYDSKTQQCSIKLIAESLKKLAQLNNKENNKN